MIYLYVLATSLLTVFGQLLIKHRLAHFGSVPESLGDKAYYFFTVFTDPFIILAFGSAFAGAVFWILAMAKMDITLAYPMIAAGLVLFTFLGGIVLLEESVTAAKLLGTGLICSGVLVLGLNA